MVYQIPPYLLGLDYYKYSEDNNNILNNSFDLSNIKWDWSNNNNQDSYEYANSNLNPNYNTFSKFETLPDQSKVLSTNPDTYMLGNKQITPKKSNFNGSKISGISNLVQTGLGDIFSVVDSSKSKLDYGTHRPFQYTNNYNDLSHERANYLDTSNLHAPTVGEAAIDLNMRTAKGAMAGLSLGPWGALAGAIAGSVMSGINMGTKAATYKKDIAKANNLNQQFYNSYLRNFNNNFNDITLANQERMNKWRSGKIMAEGGELNTYPLLDTNIIGNGGSHEQNPNNGVQYGVDQNGTPNLVQEGEVVWNNFVFSNEIKPDENILKKFSIYFRKKFLSYADVAKHIINLHKDYQYDAPHQNSYEVEMERLKNSQEYQKISEEAAEFGMEPEEYIQYQQNQQNQQMQQQMAMEQQAQSDIQMQQQLQDVNTQLPSFEQNQIMAFGGNLYKDGGDFNALNSPHDQTKLVRHYYRDSQTKNAAYQLDRLGYYLDILMYRPLENDEQERFNWTLQHALPYLQNDPKAQVYLKDRMGWSNEILNGILSDYEIPSAHGLPTNNLSAQEKRIERVNYHGSKNTPSRRANFEFGEIPRQLYSNTPVQTQTVSSLQPNTTSNGVAYYNVNRTINNPQYQYWDPKQRSLISQSTYSNLTPEEQGRMYKIGIKGGKGYDGRINYPDNPEYINKYNALTDDDWQKIKETLGDNYKNYTVDALKKGGNDNLFGNIHKAAINYIYDRDANIPIPETITEEPIINTTTEEPKVQLKSLESNNIQESNPTSKWEAILGANNPFRYAPVFDNIRSVIEQNKPDYTYSNQIASLYQPATYNPQGERMYYTPVDQYYLANQAQQRANTFLGGVKNNAATNNANAYMQSMANQQYQNEIANNYLQAINNNNQQRNTSLQYNNQLDLQNEQNRMAVEQYNLSNRQQIMANAYQAAEEERLAVENAREANKQNLANNLGLIGKEQSDYYNVNHNPALMYGAFGTFYKNLTPEQQKAFDTTWNNIYGNNINQKQTV